MAAVLTDTEVAALEDARAEGGPVAEAAMQAQIDADREKLAEAERMEAEFEAAAPTREEIDDAHADAAAETGEPSDVPGVAGLDPEPLDEEDTGQMAVPVVDEGRFTLNAGGKKPTSASLTLQGGKIEWPDELKKGRKVRVTFTCRVGGVHFDDKVDSKTGQVVASERKQILKPIAPAEVELL